MVEVTCACGCGEPVKPGRTWIKNHNKRGRTGADAPNWKGGRYTDQDGYVQVRVGDRYVPEHRLVMERKLGRKLEPDEDVHHENEIKDDNREENLTLEPHVDHSQIHRTMRRYER